MAIGEEGAKQAMLHVKQGHVLVHRDLNGSRRTPRQKLKQLVEGQVIAGRDPLQAPMVQEPGRGERVGHVQGKIAYARGQRCQQLQLVGIAHQITVGLGPDQGVHRPALIGPGDPGTSQPNSPRPDAATDGDGLLELMGLLQLGNDPVHGLIAQGLELIQAAHQHHHLGALLPVLLGSAGEPGLPGVQGTQDLGQRRFGSRST